MVGVPRFASKRVLFVSIILLSVSAYLLSPILFTSIHISWQLPLPFSSPRAGHRISKSGHPLANATFFVLCRNSDLDEVMDSMHQVENRFNHKYGYPWVFLNDKPFTDEFKMRIQVMTESPVTFGLIPSEHWNQPPWIDEERAALERFNMATDTSRAVPYGGSLSYRNMCRFNSGFFYWHELLQPYRYYWRVEPGVKFFCDLDYDPFVMMQEQNKTYGFTVSFYEYKETILTLWDTVKDFVRKNPGLIPHDNMMDFISDDGGETYNLCHYWSNFEIADMDFWRGEAYSKFFDCLDRQGGFYYERWGDAPVHSIGASLFLPKEQIHFFEDIGYRHEPFQHCPDGDIWSKGRCSCDPTDNFDTLSGSCLPRWKALRVGDESVE